MVNKTSRKRTSRKTSRKTSIKTTRKTSIKTTRKTSRKTTRKTSKKTTRKTSKKINTLRKMKGGRVVEHYTDDANGIAELTNYLKKATDKDSIDDAIWNAGNLFDNDPGFVSGRRVSDRIYDFMTGKITEKDISTPNTQNYVPNIGGLRDLVIRLYKK